MSRWASALNEAAAELDTIYGCFLLDLDFTSGHLRCNDSGIPISFGGNEYVPFGTFGRFDGVTEDTDGVAYGVRFELAGVDSGLIATIGTERFQGRPATLYVGMLTEDSQLVDTPEVVWSGFMDTMDLEVSGTTARIILQCEHRVRQSCPVSRFSDAEQRTLYPGDRVFEFLHLVAGYTSSWGGKSTGWNSKPGGGYTPG